MNLYAVHTNRDTDGDVDTIWCGSQPEAAAARKKFIAEGSKRADLTTYTVEVPTDKAGLMQFLNDYASGTKVMVATRNLLAK